MENNTIKYAGFFPRFFATLIDYLFVIFCATILFLVLLILNIFIARVNGGFSKILSAIQTFIPILTMLIGKEVYRWFKDGNNGTIGRKITKTKVVNESDFSSITTTKSFSRQFVYMLLNNTGIIALVNLALLTYDTKRQTITDKIAQTVVIKY